MEWLRKLLEWPHKLLEWLYRHSTNYYICHPERPWGVSLGELHKLPLPQSICHYLASPAILQLTHISGARGSCRACAELDEADIVRKQGARNVSRLHLGDPPVACGLCGEKLPAVVVLRSPQEGVRAMGI